MNHRQIVNSLGGYREIAAALNMSPVVVWRWQQRGIPSRHWPRLIEIAGEKGVEGISAHTLMVGRHGRGADAVTP